MEIMTFFYGVFTTTVLLGIAAFLLKSWVEARLIAAVQHEYDRKIVEYETQQDIKMKAEVVAELFSEWLEKNENYAGYKDLNKVSFQSYLWLPKELAQSVSDTLAHEDDSETVRQLLEKVRTELLGAGELLDSNQVIVFPTQHKKSQQRTK